jgi:hypothetical protein
MQVCNRVRRFMFVCSPPWMGVLLQAALTHCSKDWSLEVKTGGVMYRVEATELQNLMFDPAAAA